MPHLSRLSNFSFPSYIPSILPSNGLLLLTLFQTHNSKSSHLPTNCPAISKLKRTHPRSCSLSVTITLQRQEFALAQIPIQMTSLSRHLFPLTTSPSDSHLRGRSSLFLPLLSSTALHVFTQSLLWYTRIPAHELNFNDAHDQHLGDSAPYFALI